MSCQRVVGLVRIARGKRAIQTIFFVEPIEQKQVERAAKDGFLIRFIPLLRTLFAGIALTTFVWKIAFPRFGEWASVLLYEQ